MVRNPTLTRRFFIQSATATSLMPMRSFAQDRPTLILKQGPLVLPAIQAKRGQPFQLRIQNDMQEATSLHGRGLRIRHDMDGAAPLTQKPILPGETFDLSFTPPDAGTYLFHAGLRENAARQMASGVLFPFIVADEKDPVCELDLTCLLQETRRGEDATPHLLINGADTILAHDLQPGARIRLRILSGSTQQMMSIGFEGTRAFVAAIDGQPCGMFEPDKQTLPLAPGQRYDVFFDLPRETGRDVSCHLRALGRDPKAATVIAAFHTQGATLAERAPFAGLANNPQLPDKIALQQATRRDVTLERSASGGWLINGAPADTFAPAPLLSVKRGRPVVLGFINKTGQPQLIHLHGHVMRHIHLFDDGWDPYWRDTIIVPEKRTMRVAFVADRPGRWALTGGMDRRDGPTAWLEVT